jgi:hypothetical protein
MFLVAKDLDAPFYPQTLKPLQIELKTSAVVQKLKIT